ncbi:MAG: tRNA-dihydrouridine synthase family protein [Chthoniobacteraceae bacterium]|nr:tRNA-dihydrouridine synthase family protein [Chthoniobacteraceae bacterium]
MDLVPSFASLLAAHRPLLALAPMQDITDLPFWRVMHRYGGADLYYTEYLRVHRDSKPERHILRDIDENPTGRPVIAQMIGEDIPSLVRTAKALQRHPVFGIDLNLGCPAPIVCRKSAGGGLLRHLEKIDAILRALRPAIEGPFTVKTRIGYDDPAEFDALLEIFAAHAIDAFTVHGRTVRELYRTRVHLERIRQAVERLSAPVLANGNVLSVALARETLAATGAAGLMMGRGAIRNPWLFQQIRDDAAGLPVFRPTLRDLRAYIAYLYAEVRLPHLNEATNVARIKKYLNFIGQGIGPDEAFLRGVRRAATEKELFGLCDRHLDSDTPFPAEPPVRALVCPRSEALAAG